MRAGELGQFSEGCSEATRCNRVRPTQGRRASLVDLQSMSRPDRHLGLALPCISVDQKRTEARATRFRAAGRSVP